MPLELLNLDFIRKASRELGFVTFEIDACEIRTVAALMDAFSRTMNFPAFSSPNWDALFDCTTDLSWLKASGYTLVLLNADSLQSLGDEAFSSLLAVMEHTVWNWRDERGEYGERTGPVPFHVVFSGSDALLGDLLVYLREPVCEHMSELSVRVVRITRRVAESEGFRDAQRLMQGGAELELVLSFIREGGADKRESVYALAALTGKTVSEAKALVDGSQTWSDQSDEKVQERFRDLARKALRDLGYDDS